MKKTLGFRRAPWDMQAVRSRNALVPYDPQSELPTLVPCRVCLQGHWFVDPRTVTPEDARLFMWEGLRVFRSEAKAKGIPDSQINDMIQEMFGHFHDAATDIYCALLRMIQAAPPKHGIKWLELHHGRSFWMELEPECAYISCADQPNLEDCQTVTLVEGSFPDKSAHEDLFVACEEDRPVPVTVRYRKLEPLLDPDRDLLESFES